MCSQWAALAMSAIAILAAVARPLAPPATGWMIFQNSNTYIFPFTATQCEPFYIFYNATDGNFLNFYDATLSHTLFIITFPKGTGYVEWICNIPAGITLLGLFNYTVQAGLSSACLGNITTTYSHLTYNTTVFASFTRAASPLITPLPTNTLYVSFPVRCVS